MNNVSSSESTLSFNGFFSADDSLADCCSSTNALENADSMLNTEILAVTSDLLCAYQQSEPSQRSKGIRKL